MLKLKLGFLLLLILSVFRFEHIIRPSSDEVEFGFNSPNQTDSSQVKNSKLYILLVDGLAYRTAIDRSIMPNLVKLKESGIYSKVKTTFEAYSSSAIRAAFSGLNQRSIFDVVYNFNHNSNLNRPSVLSDLTQKGYSIGVFSYGHFNQFGNVFDDLYPYQLNLPHEETDRFIPEMSFNRFKNSSYDLIIAHYETTDWAGHQYGTLAKPYQDEHRHIDSLIGQFATQLAENEYILVFGDHGMSLKGEHKTGMDLPTYMWFSGKSIPKGQFLGEIDITLLPELIKYLFDIQINTNQLTLHALTPLLKNTLAIKSEKMDAHSNESFNSELKKGIEVALFIFACFILFNWWLQLTKKQCDTILPFTYWLLTSFLLLWSNFLALILIPVFSYPLFYRKSQTHDNLLPYKNGAYYLMILISTGLIFHAMRLNDFVNPIIILSLILLNVALFISISFSSFIQRKDQWLILSGGLLVASLHTLGLPKVGLIIGLIPLFFFEIKPTKPNVKVNFFLTSVGILIVLFFIGFPYLLKHSNWMIYSPNTFIELILIYSVGIIAKGYLVSRFHNKSLFIVVIVLLFALLLVAELQAITTLFSISKRIFYVLTIGTTGILSVVLQKKYRQQAAFLAFSSLQLALYYFFDLSIYQLFFWDIFLALGLLIWDFLKKKPIDDQQRSEIFTLFFGILILGSNSIWVINTTSGIEWSFLYDWIHAYQLESNVLFFLPFIVGKLFIPIALLYVLFPEIRVYKTSIFRLLSSTLMIILSFYSIHAAFSQDINQFHLLVESLLLVSIMIMAV